MTRKNPAVDIYTTRMNAISIRDDEGALGRVVLCTSNNKNILYVLHILPYINVSVLVWVHGCTCMYSHIGGKHQWHNLYITASDIQIDTRQEAGNMFCCFAQYHRLSVFLWLNLSYKDKSLRHTSTFYSNFAHVALPARRMAICTCVCNEKCIEIN